MSIQSHHARLLGTLLAIAGIAPMCAMSAAGCGGTAATTGEADAGDGGGFDDKMRNCGGSQAMTQEASGPICVDASADAGDAGATDAEAADASADADTDASTVDGGACFATCAEACQHAFPGYSFGTGSSCSVMFVEQRDRIMCNYKVFHPCGRGFGELLSPQGGSRGVGLGALFAHAAWMEAASITAFRRLARELVAHDAPVELVRAARDAARDEVRHARAMARLARRWGGEIPRVEHAPFAPRTLEALAIENAKEACVGETYGAALAAWQARHAQDDEVRSAMEAIAGDELRHAALGHAIADWVATKLDARARGRVRAATREALAALAREVAIESLSHEVIRDAGMPTPRDALRLASAVGTSLAMA